MIPVFDGHIDSLQEMYLPDENPRSLLKKSDEGHFDLPRAEEGGCAGAMFAIFVPTVRRKTIDLTEFPEPEDERLKPVEPGYAAGLAEKGLACLQRLSENSGGRLQVVRTVGDVVRNLQSGTISAVIHFEGAEPIASDLSNLEKFTQTGLRSVGVVWSRANVFGNGVDYKFPGTPDTGPGLTDAGKRLVQACNRLGILVDLSHMNEKGFWDVARISAAPLVATHSCMHALTPISRNLTDRQLDAIRASNGIVGINFCTGFLRSDAQLVADTPVAEIVRHIRYAAERMGIDHVAIGSDFDGAQVPREIGDVSGLPKLVDALRADGFDAPSIRKIAHENWIRVFAETWK
jgi:membrane dipeptidase